ncbi:MAG: LptF/LptG family permease [Planctomycetota bacterium]|nr:MAG: LptF/LptG family permease [Planctomycetota bacterium]
MISILDRYMVSRTLAAFLVIIVVVVSVAVGIDILMRMHELMGAENEGRTWGLAARYYLYSLPAIVSPLVPLSLAAAITMACAPVLKRREFVALSSSGINLRRATRGIIILTAIIGLADVALNDQLRPRMETTRQSLEDQIGGQVRSARMWQVETTGTWWYANRVVLHDPSSPLIEDVAIIPPRHGMLQAQALEHKQGQWHLRGPIMIWEQDEDGIDAWRMEEGPLSATGILSMPYDGNRLSQLLVSRHALTGDELWQRGGHLNTAMLAQRWSRLAMMLCVALVVLPAFVQFHNRDRLMLAAISAIAMALLPVLVITIGGLSADAAGISPLISVGAAVAVALLPSAWYYQRWRL